jgi:hypothetical protein
MKRNLFLYLLVGLVMPVVAVQRHVVIGDEPVMLPIPSARSADQAIESEDSICLNHLLDVKTPLYQAGSELETRLVVYEKAALNSPKKIERAFYIVESDQKFKNRVDAKGNKLLRRTVLTIKGTEKCFGRTVKVCELWKSSMPQHWVIDSAVYMTDHDEFRYWAPLKYSAYASVFAGLVATVGGFIKF